MTSRMTRRDFLAESAILAGAAGWSLPAAGRDDKADAKPAGPNGELRVAVIGVRGRGMDHVSGYAKHKGHARITTICDCDTSVIGSAMKAIADVNGSEPKYVQDVRRVMEDPNIDIVSIAMPNHWHALASIRACQAGKDVYVEKPVSHNVREGRKIVEAARKYERIVQTGTQCRSHKGIRDAMAFLHAGKLGSIYMAKGLCYKPRGSIGHQPDGTPPASLNYDLWTGPAEMRPYNPNKLHYNWHWIWNTGNGDLGNQGIHQMDLARWGLNKREFPRAFQGSGGRFGYVDDGETPNTELVAFDFEDSLLQFEVRGLATNDEMGVKIGDLFFGTEGVLAIRSYTDWQVFRHTKRGDLEKAEGGTGGGDHFGNFLDAVRARDPKVLNADIEEGHLSSAYCHLGNIAYRLGRKLKIDPSTEAFVGDAEANAMLTRKYREPYVVPESV